MPNLIKELISHPVLLETERLKLIPVSEKAKGDIGRLLSDPQVRNPAFFMPVLDTVAYEEWWYKQQQQLDTGKLLRYVACLKSNNAFCGLLTLKGIDDALLRAELGYSLIPVYWGKGYAHEAALRLVEYGFKSLNLHSIFAIVFPGNRPSVKLIERLGFVKEGQLKEYFPYNNRFWDVWQYSRINPEH